MVAAVEPVYEVAGEEPSPTPPPSPTPSSGRGVLVPAVLAVLVIALAVWVSRTIFESRGEVSAPPHSRVGVLTGAGSPLRAGAESQADAGSLSRAGAELQADGEPLSRVGAGSQADVEPLSGTGGSSQADADSRSRADKRGATRISRVTSAPSAQSGANSAADHTGAIARLMAQALQRPRTRKADAHPTPTPAGTPTRWHPRKMCPSLTPLLPHRQLVRPQSRHQHSRRRPRQRFWARCCTNDSRTFHDPYAKRFAGTSA